MLVAALGYLVYQCNRRYPGPSGVVIAASLVLVVIPTCSPLGWAHVYVFALPLLLLLLVNLGRLNRLSQWICWAALIALAVPCWTKIGWIGDLHPALVNLFYSRYLVASLALCCVAGWCMQRGAFGSSSMDTAPIDVAEAGVRQPSHA